MDTCVDQPDFIGALAVRYKTDGVDIGVEHNRGLFVADHVRNIRCSVIQGTRLHGIDRVLHCLRAFAEQAFHKLFVGGTEFVRAAQNTGLDIFADKGEQADAKPGGIDAVMGVRGGHIKADDVFFRNKTCQAFTQFADIGVGQGETVKRNEHSRPVAGAVINRNRAETLVVQYRGHGVFTEIIVKITGRKIGGGQHIVRHDAYAFVAGAPAGVLRRGGLTHRRTRQEIFRNIVVIMSKIAHRENLNNGFHKIIRNAADKLDEEL